MKTSAMTTSPGQQFQSSLVQEIVVTSATNLITFSGLDGNSDKGYYLEYEMINALVAQQILRIYVNGDFTDVNYKATEMLDAYTTTFSGDGTAAPTLPSLMGLVGATAIGNLLLTSFDGYFHYHGPWEMVDASGNPFVGVTAGKKNVAITNILQIDIKDITAAGIGVGSRFRLMRRNSSQPVISSSGPSNLVEKKVLTTDTNSVTFLGLNSLVDGDYTLEYSILCGSTTIVNTLIGINGDFTAANYDRHYLYGDTMTGAGNQLNTVPAFGGVDASRELVGRVTLSAINSKVVMKGDEFSYSGTKYNRQFVTMLYKLAGFSSISSVVINTQQTIKAGSTFRLYKSVTGTGSTSTGLQTSNITTATLASLNRRYLADTSTGFPFTLTLPQFPQTGDQVEVIDSHGTFGSNAVTLGMNGIPIDGIAQDLVLDLNNVKATLTYSGDANKGWTLDIGSNQTLQAPITELSRNASLNVHNYYYLKGAL